MGDVFGKVSAISYYIIIEKQTDTSILLAAIFLIRELKIYIIVKTRTKVLVTPLNCCILMIVICL